MEFAIVGLDLDLDTSQATTSRQQHKVPPTPQHRCYLFHDLQPNYETLPNNAFINASNFRLHSTKEILYKPSPRSYIIHHHDVSTADPPLRLDRCYRRDSRDRVLVRRRPEDEARDQAGATFQRFPPSPLTICDLPIPLSSPPYSESTQY